MSKSTMSTHIVLLLLLLCFSAPAQAQFAISGTVSSPTGPPAANVDVILYDENGDNPIPWTVTDGSGAYVISGLPAATYGVGYEPDPATGLLPWFEPVVVVAGNVTLNVSLVQGVILSGFVTDTSGMWIFGIDLNVYDVVTGDKFDTPGDNTDSTGFYDVLIPVGLYRLRWRPVGGERWVPVVYEDVAITGDTTINVTMESGFFVTGTVRDQFAVPIENADMDFMYSLTGLPVPTPGDNTDTLGMYKVIVPSGTFDITVEPQVVDKVLAAQLFAVVIGGDTTINITLGPGLSISGVVRNSGGIGVANADIDVKDALTGQKLLTPWDKTDGDGNYEIIVPSGQFDLIYQPQVASSLAPVELTATTISIDTIINVTAPDGVTLSGTVQNSFGMPVAMVDIDVEDPITGAKLPLVGDKTDALGAFAVVTVPGTFDLQFEPQKTRRLAAVQLSSVLLSQDTAVFITLDSGRLITGTVFDSLGAPMAEVRAFALKTTNGDTIFTPANLSDTTGTYEIVLLPDTYDLSYQPDSLSGYSTPVIFGSTTVANDTVINVNFPTAGDQPPTLAAIGNRSVAEEAQLVILISATDAETIPVLSTSLPLPPGAVFTDSGNGNGSLIWTPDSTQSGQYQVTFYAEDTASQIDFEQITITVSESGVCCIGIRGDIDSSGGIDVSDLGYLVDYLFRGGPPPLCTEEGDLDGSGGIDVSDLGYIVDYLFRGGPLPVACP